MNTSIFSPQPQIACIIMASGMSKRFGSNKLITNFLGKPMISYIIKTVNKLAIQPAFIITRHSEIAALCTDDQIKVVLHEKEMRNEVIQLGIEQIRGSQVTGCMFCQSDQPLLTADSINKLIDSFYENPDKIHRLCCGDTLGSPIIFPRKYFDELMALPQKCGGRYLLQKYPSEIITVPIENAYELMDIDTTDELHALELYATHKKEL